MRRSGVAAVFIAAAVALSGCWGVVRNDPNFSWKFITVKKGIGEILIWNCTVDHQTESGRAICVLDNLRALCDAKPLAGVTRSECYAATDHRRIVDMEGAIRDILITDPNYQFECLRVGIYKPDPLSDLSNWDAVRLGQFDCVG